MKHATRRFAGPPIFYSRTWNVLAPHWLTAAAFSVRSKSWPLAPTGKATSSCQLSSENNQSGLKNNQGKSNAARWSTGKRWA